MDKKEALKIVFEGAKVYKENLENKNILFLSLHNKSRFNYIETRFLKSNYQHLTGIIINENSISPSYFYEKCLNKRLSINEFEFKSDGTTPLKLSVLLNMMDIYKNSKMIGDFNGTKPVLYSDKLTGNNCACMGFKKEGRYYVPVTVLKEDIRDLITNQERIIAILSKNINCELYTNIHYSPKNVDNADNIPGTIIKMIDIENLVYDFEEKHIQTNPFLLSLIRQISSAKDL